MKLFGLKNSELQLTIAVTKLQFNSQACQLPRHKHLCHLWKSSKAASFMPKSDTKDTTRFVTYKFTFLFSKTHNKSINYFIKYVVDVTNNYVYCQLAKKISLSHSHQFIILL